MMFPCPHGHAWPSPLAAAECDCMPTAEPAPAIL